MWTNIYAATMTALFLATLCAHFWNPFPLFPFPDRGNAHIAVPSKYHDVMIEAFEMGGVPAYNSFTMGGIRRTIFRDSIRMIVSGDPKALPAIFSFSTNDPRGKAEEIAEFLRSKGIEVAGPQPPDPELSEKLMAIRLPSFGVELAYRLPVWKLPRPKWEK